MAQDQMKLSTTKQNIYFSLGIVLILAIWIITSVVMNNPLAVPKIDSVLSSLGNILGEGKSYLIIFNTFSRIFLATCVSIIVAFALALGSNFSNRFYYLIKPFMAFLRSTPIAAIIVVLLMIFGNQKTPYVITAFMIIPVLYEGILISFQKIDKNILEEVKMQTNFNFFVFKNIYLPISMPYILSAALTAIGLGIKVMVMAEFIANTPDTIGYQIVFEKNALEYANVYGWIIILLVFVFTIELIIKKVQNKVNSIS